MEFDSEEDEEEEKNEAEEEEVKEQLNVGDESKVSIYAILKTVTRSGHQDKVLDAITDKVWFTRHAIGCKAGGRRPRGRRTG